MSNSIRRNPRSRGHFRRDGQIHDAARYQVPVKAARDRWGTISRKKLYIKPNFIRNVSSTTLTFLGASTNLDGAAAVTSLCDEALERNSSKRPGVSLVLHTKGVPVSGYCVTDGVRTAFPECQGVQLLSFSVCGALSRLFMGSAANRNVYS
jgi:hypothetical protein